MKNIINELESCTSGRTSQSMKTIIDTKTGTCKVVVEHSVRRYFDIKDIEEAKSIYNDVKEGVNIDKLEL